MANLRLTLNFAGFSLAVLALLFSLVLVTKGEVDTTILTAITTIVAIVLGSLFTPLAASR